MYSETWSANAKLLSSSSSRVSSRDFFLFSSFAGFYDRPSPFPYRKHALPQGSPVVKRSWTRTLRAVVSSLRGFRSVVEDYFWVLLKLPSGKFRHLYGYLPLKTGNLGGIRLFFFPFTRKKLNGPFLKAAEQFAILAPRISDRKIETVCEIGGGFGALAEVVIRNTSPRKYFIIDLPEALEIAHNYLAWSASIKDASNVWRASSLDSFMINETEIVFIDATTFDASQPGAINQVDLFLNSNSFGEMDAEVLGSYLQLINAEPGALLLSANRRRQEGEHNFDPLAFTSGFPNWERVHTENQRAHKSFRRNIVTIHAVN